MDVQRIIERLGLEPHPEGGRFVETWRAQERVGDRSAATAIYYLLTAGEESSWHRVDGEEVWHFYLGDPLEHEIVTEIGGVESLVLGSALDAGQHLQRLVPAGAWQRAETIGAWSLVGCTMAPGFEAGGFELAPERWSPVTGDERSDA